jgi:hypothetical protein
MLEHPSALRAVHLAVCRDVFNEKPSSDDIVPADNGAANQGATLPRGAIIHTTRGDIVLRLFPDECPKVPLSTTYKVQPSRSNLQGLTFKVQNIAPTLHNRK